MATKKGSRSALVLPDGTKVWLNADSRLSYPEKFTAAAREVQLTGEAFFEVTKDAKHPFIVHTENIDVRVLGTRFNVRAYPGETSTQTTLLKGSVEVLLKNNNDKRVMLSPNEKLIVQNNTVTENKKRTAKQDKITAPAKVELVTIKPNQKDSSVFETEWMHDRLVFDSERIEDIVPVLERWYNTTIVFKGNPSGQTFSGSFKNAPLEDVLKALKLSAGINYKTEDGKIEIY